MVYPKVRRHSTVAVVTKATGWKIEELWFDTVISLEIVQTTNETTHSSQRVMGLFPRV